ncbi:MAG: hypothetical protein IPL78_10345 [Chloroflexi bacterium]|nr:hypothetical protein [Chloroflexota bacterium]
MADQQRLLALAAAITDNVGCAGQIVAAPGTTTEDGGLRSFTICLLLMFSC